MKKMPRVGLHPWRFLGLPAVLLALLPTAAPAQVSRNDEFGIEARFPAGGRVCLTRSGGHPLGFFAWYGGRPTDCDTTRGDPRASVLAVYGAYNTTFDAPASRVLSEECIRGAARRPTGIDLRGLSFRGYGSASCAYRRTDGTIHVEIVAQGGRFHADGTNYPRINYTAALVTRPGRLTTDMAMFRRFLAGIRLAPPD